MPDADDSLEELVRRPARQDPAASRPLPAGFEARCDCGARIITADLYGERGDVELGRPRLQPAERVLLYRCPLCGHTGELRVER